MLEQVTEYRYTCLSCHVTFRDLTVQRQHYKSDWHRYNLKRKECELPPLAFEKFQKRALAEQNVEDEQHQLTPCALCKKTFNTKNQYENHKLSKKHKEKILTLNNKAAVQDDDESMKEANEAVTDLSTVKPSTSKEKNKCVEDDMEIDSDVESVDSYEWVEENPAEKNNCLFCNHHSKTLTKNLKHMTEAHSFFIPYVEYCVDIKELLVYLGEKISTGYMCLWCKSKMFNSLDAVKSHMLDKNHTKMLFEGEALAEYTEFYDFNMILPDVTNPLDVVEISEVDSEDHQLVLPSGSVIGHRSLMRYYKQSTDPSKQILLKNSDKLKNVLSMYKSLGWTETKKESAKQKAMDMKFITRVQQKYATKLGVKANKLQMHFRAQTN